MYTATGNELKGREYRKEVLYFLEDCYKVIPLFNDKP